MLDSVAVVDGLADRVAVQEAEELGLRVCVRDADADGETVGGNDTLNEMLKDRVGLHVCVDEGLAVGVTEKGGDDVPVARRVHDL
ncbi:MAG: hypothetical protein COA68_12270 [Oceanobacter sp.]|nr:MAG: hypothetical protein COA68_12270 [Oceanobacter sp.]